MKNRSGCKIFPRRRDISDTTMHSEMGAARVPLRKKFLFMIAVVWWHLPAASVKAAAGGSPDEGHHVSLTLVIAGVATLSLV